MGELFLAAASTKASSGGTSYLLLFVVVLFGLFYFVAIRPQRNRQRRAMQTQNELVPGQRVRTTAGMYATIAAVDGDDVILEVAPGVEVRYLRRAVMNVLPDDDGPDAGEEATDEDADYSEATDEVGEESDTTDGQDSADQAEGVEETEVTPTASAPGAVAEDGPADGPAASANGSTGRSARKGRTAG